MFFIRVAILSLLTAIPSSYAASSPIREAAPDFTLTDMQGIAHNLVDYRGSVVVLNFWASWCPECGIEMPSLEGLYNRLKKDGLVVLGYPSTGPAETSLKWQARYLIQYCLTIKETCSSKNTRSPGAGHVNYRSRWGHRQRYLRWAGLLSSRSYRGNDAVSCRRKSGNETPFRAYRSNTCHCPPGRLRPLDILDQQSG